MGLETDVRACQDDGVFGLREVFAEGSHEGLTIEEGRRCIGFFEFGKNTLVDGFCLGLIANRSVTFDTTTIHQFTQGDMNIYVVVDAYFVLIGIVPMEATSVLFDDTFPRNGDSEHKRIKPWEIKAFSDIFAGSDNDQRFVCGNGM